VSVYHTFDINCSEDLKSQMELGTSLPKYTA
jgi:hypothetical protein